MSPLLAFLPFAPACGLLFFHHFDLMDDLRNAATWAADCNTQSPGSGSIEVQASETACLLAAALVDVLHLCDLIAVIGVTEAS